MPRPSSPRRRMCAAPCAAIVAALALVAPARAAEVSLGGGLGLTLASQPGVREWIESERAIVGGSLSTARWKTRLGPGVTPAIEFRLRVHPQWTVGLSAEGFRSERRNEAFGSGASLQGWESRFEQQFSDVAAHVAWWPAAVRGGYVGARVGRGRGTLSLNGGGVLTSDPNAQVPLSGTWRASATTWGAYAGWQAAWMANPRVDVRVGWTARGIGRPDAGAWGNVTGPARGALRDASGRVLDIDFSGPYAALAFVFVRTAAP